MKHGLFVYNPNSGGQAVAEELDAIIREFQKKDILVQMFRTGPDNQHLLTELIKSRRWDLITAAGGDGTINMVADTMLKSGADYPFGVIPAGTCNDFAMNIGMPSSVAECVKTIAAGKTAKVDLGIVNGNKTFLATCAGGNFVNVSYKTDAELKKTLGQAAYYVAALNELVHPKAYTITMETEEHSAQYKDVLMFLILNGSQAGGFSGVVKEADMSDGLMDIILIKKGKPFDVVDVFFKVLWQNIQANQNVMVLKAKTCRITSNEKIPITLDGEFGGHLPVDLEFQKQKLTVFVP